MVKAVKIYLIGLRKQRHLTNDSPTKDNKGLMWIQEDVQILGALWNSREPRIAYICSHYQGQRLWSTNCNNQEQLIMGSVLS